MTTMAAQMGWPGAAIGNGAQIRVHAVQLHRSHGDSSIVSTQQFYPRLDKLDKRDVVSLSEPAQYYLEQKQTEAINQVTDQLNLAAKIVSSTSTSDSQRFAAIASAYHLFFEGGTLGAITGSFASAWGRFRAATSDSEFNKYFAVGKQFVPSISPSVESSGQKTQPDLWAQFFINKSSTGTSDFSRSLAQDNVAPEGAAQEQEGQAQDSEQIDTGRLIQAENALYASNQEDEPLISLVDIEKAATPREKQVLEKILNTSHKKANSSSKSAN